VQEQIRWDRFAACWYCGIPQAICEQWESNDGLWRRKKGGECQFRGVLIEAVMAVWYAGSERVEEFVFKEMGKSGLEVSKNKDFAVVVGGVVGWFGKKLRVCGVEGSNICEIFRRFG